MQSQISKLWLIITILICSIIGCNQTTAINQKEEGKVIKNIMTSSREISKDEFIQRFPDSGAKKIAYLVDEENDSQHNSFFMISSLDKSEIHKIGKGYIYVSFDWSPNGDQAAVALMGETNSVLHIYDLKTKSYEPTSKKDGFLFYDFGTMKWNSSKGIVFSANENQSKFSDLYNYNMESKYLEKLYISPRLQDRLSPSYSNDGTKIAFYSKNTDNSSSNTEEFCYSYFDEVLTTFVNDAQIDILCGNEYRPWKFASPRWDNLGMRFLTVGDKDGKTHVLLFDTKENEYKDLGLGDYPDWSPDGKRIVFSRDGELFILNLGGIEEKINISGYGPKWSMDGKFISYFFPSGPKNDWAIFITDPQGSFRYKLDNSSGVLYSVFWQP